MENVQYQELKDLYITHIKDLIKDMGSLYPHVTVLAVNKDKDDVKNSVIHIPVPEKMMESDEDKESFVEDILPEVFSEIKKKFTPQAVCWASEAWLRILENHEELPDDYKKLPIKKEVIIITIDKGESNEVIVYEVQREGKQINQFGDLVDVVNLKELPELDKAVNVGGKFSGLFKKFN